MKVPYTSVVAIPVLSSIILLIGYWDYRTGFMLSLFPLYLIPLVLIAWHDKKTVTLAMSLAAGAIIVVKDTVGKYPAEHGFYYIWDESVKVVLLILISYGVWEIRALLEEKDRTNQELTKALSEIRELREMIPICAWCHSIRNDRGFYEKVEVYLSQLTGATFTHGICPSCMKKYYSHLTDHEHQEGPSPLPDSDKEQR
jgi:hypothetical protein